MTSDEMIKIMGSKGLRITEQRKTLAQIFADSEGYLTPKAVYDQMSLLYPGLSFDTVYRNLRLMHEMDVIEQFIFEDGLKFKVHCQGSHHHHHLICMECEKTLPITFCPMEQAQLSLIPSDFQVVKHKFEVYGYCSDCKADEGITSND